MAYRTTIFPRALILVLALVFTGAHASGGSNASTLSSTATPEASATRSPQQVAAFAKQVEKALAAKGARVALVSRMGRPLSEMPEGMRYTHVGFAVYSQITTADGRKVPGYAMFNLYQKNEQPDRSALVQDYPADFFSGAVQLESGIIIPSPALQERLLKVLASPTYAALHEPRYSVIANPYTLGRQNCTEFVLDVIQAAIYQTDRVDVIKANTRAYFKAQPVKVNPFKLLLGSVFSAEVSTSDQEGGTPLTATFERIADYLRQADPETQVMTLTPCGASASGCERVGGPALAP